MTREQRKLRRRRILCWIAATAVIVVWLAVLLTVCARAADAAEAAQELDPLTKTLACIGAAWVSWALMRVVRWIDAPKGARR